LPGKYEALSSKPVPPEKNKPKAQKHNRDEWAM
jgi:hypothetical protein